jgi:hypothetical protein
MSEPVWKSRATAVENGDFIAIRADSGYRLAIADPTAKEHLLEPDAPDHALGLAVSEALAQSRFLTLEESRALESAATKWYDQWVKTLMERYRYKSKKALFKNMKKCGIERINGQIKISPMRHNALDGWYREKDDKIANVFIAADSPPADIGAALRLAFRRCTG